MYMFQVKALREEVKFHQSVYDLQLEYTHSLLDAVRYVDLNLKLLVRSDVVDWVITLVTKLIGCHCTQTLLST